MTPKTASGSSTNWSGDVSSLPLSRENGRVPGAYQRAGRGRQGC